MKKIMKTSDIVKHVLMSYPETRSNDKALYFHVCRIINRRALDVPFGLVVLNLDEYSLPNHETVTRSRRKLQAEYPELSANEEVERNRLTQEQKFKKYAKAVNV